MENNNFANYILPVGILVLVGSVAQKFGLLPSAESKKTEKDAAALTTLTAFNRNFAKDYIKQKGTPGRQYKTVLLTTPKAELLAQQLKKAKGIFNDDESAVYSVFRIVKTQTQISQVAKVFFDLTGRELVSFLESFMNEKELAKIYELVNGLPVGITAA